MTDPFVLTLSCPNRAGIVQAVSSHLGAYGCDIVEHQQFDDPVSGRLFMRTRASTDTELDTLAAGFAESPPRSGWSTRSTGTPRRAGAGHGVEGRGTA